MAQSQIMANGIPQSVTLTTDTSVGLTNNNSYARRIGKLALLTLDFKKAAGFPKNEFTKLYTVAVHPNNFSRIQTADSNNVNCMVNINQQGEVSIYPFTGVATGFVRAIIPFVIDE